MTGPFTSGQVAACWLGAAFVFLLEAGLSTALAAVTALGRGALKRLGDESDGRYSFLDQIDDPLSEYRSAALLMRQICLLGASLLLMLGFYGAGWRQSELLGIGIAALIGILVLDALAARAIALWNPRRALWATAFLVRSARTLLLPIVLPLNRLYKRIDNGQGDEIPEEEQEEEVEALIEAGERDGLLDTVEGEMMRSIVDLDETKVREIMTPRIDIIALSVDSTVAEARSRVLEGRHSRIPVYRGSIDETVGVLHARDLFRGWEEGGDDLPVLDYLRPVIHVPEHVSVAELLSEMRMKTKLALVIDEYGGVSGLVTLEDLLEEIVGEIRDEHEQDEEDEIRRIDDGSFEVLAATNVDELEKLFEVEFPDRDFDTVGGLVISTLGRVPVAGESCEVEGLHLEVLEADRRRILRVRITTSNTPDGDEA